MKKMNRHGKTRAFQTLPKRKVWINILKRRIISSPKKAALVVMQ